MSDYPRGFRNGFFRRSRLAVSGSLAITPALPVASLFSYRRRSIALLRLPARPSPSLSPALVAAIALSGAPRTESPRASLQQTATRPRAPAWRPIFGRECRIVVRAHGRCLPEAHALEGTPLPSGAQQVPVQRRSVYRRARRRRAVLPFFSRLASAVSRYCRSRVSALPGKRLRLTR
jgi:hypothetical protein